MMKIAILALLAGSAAAFAPASQVAKASTALDARSYENEIGNVAPIGFWDPLGFTKDCDDATFDRWRTTELKHGRVAMLAVVGYVVQEFARWPGEIAPGLKFADIPNGVQAINAIPALGWAQIVFLVGAVDYRGWLGDFKAGKPDLAPDVLRKRQTQEIQPGAPLTHSVTTLPTTQLPNNSPPVTVC